MSCRHEDVAAVDPIAEVVAEASNPAIRKGLDKVERPLVHQYPAWHDDEYKQTPPVCVSGGGQSDIGFPGAGNSLDNAAASATKPTDERFELPTVEKLFGAVHSATTSRDFAGFMVHMEDPRYVTILPLVVRQLSLDLSLEVAGVGFTWSEVENEEVLGASAQRACMARQRPRARLHVVLGNRTANDLPCSHFEYKRSPAAPLELTMRSRPTARLGQRPCSQSPPEVSQPERVADYKDR